ncbi:MAG: hypothetical protein ACXVEC_07530 [Nocardioides sp.]
MRRPHPVAVTLALLTATVAVIGLATVVVDTAFAWGPRGAGLVVAGLAVLVGGLVAGGSAVSRRQRRAE